MSGPPYPPPPAPGSNAIGKFVIGVSPIGTIKPFDPIRTVISQYGNSDRLLALIDSFDDCIDQTKNMDLFFDNIWNIDTAIGHGLDVWGRILQVSRVLKIPVTSFFGFGEAGPSVVGFDQGAFNDGQQLTTNYALSDDAYRTLLLAKALANICDGSIKAINKVLMRTFPNRGNCYVTDGDAPAQPGASFGFAESQTAVGFGQAAFYSDDNLPNFFFGFGESSSARSFGEAPFYNAAPAQPRRMTYTFEFPLTPLDIAIVEESGVLPKPTGVSVSVAQRF